MSGPPPRWKVTEVADLRGDRLIIVHGELDIATAPRLAAQLDQILVGDVERISVDMQGLDFMDSSGVGVLVSAYRRGRDKGITLDIRAATPRVRMVLEALGLMQILNVAR